MNYIVVDMEWNQPYNNKITAGDNISLSGEIVQIGAVKLDEDFNEIDTFNVMVAPKYYKKIHEYVARVTKLTTEMLKKGQPFQKAFIDFKRWCGEEFVFLTWGPDDIGILRDNMIVHGFDTDWIPDSYDAQMIFARQIIEKKQQTSLSKAMEMMGEPEFAAHDALNDAVSTAVICRHLDMTRGIEEYRTMWDTLPPKAEDGVIKEYSSKKKFFNDPDFISFQCPHCKANAVCGPFVRQNVDKYISVARCENEHELFVRFRFRQVKRHKYQVSRMIYEMNDSKKEYYDKKIKQKEKRENRNREKSLSAAD